MRRSFLIIFLLPVMALSSLVPNQKQIEFQRTQEFQEKFLPTKKAFLGEEHLLFQSPREAIHWVKGLSNYFQLSFGAKKFQLVDSTDPRYVPLQEYVHELWAGFKLLFPEQTSKLNEPPVVLVDTEAVNAFIAMDPESGKVGHAVIVFTGFLDTVKSNKDAITGTFAHELAHSVFKHALPQFQKTINKFYKTRDVNLGYQAHRDSVLDKKMDQWIEAAKVAGDLSHEELLNLPSLGLGKPWLMKAWGHLRENLYDSRTECKSASLQYDEWSKLIEVDSLAQLFFISLEKLPSLKDKSQTLIDSEKKCLGNRTKKFSEVFSAITGVPVEALEQSEEFRGMAKVFDSSPNATEGFRTLVDQHRKLMGTIENETPLSELGFFTYEEHADDVSLLVHSVLNKNPEAMSQFLIRFLETMDTEIATQCQKMIDRGDVLASGSFSDAHRATCYRMAHLRDLNSQIKKSEKDVSLFAKTYLQLTLPH